MRPLAEERERRCGFGLIGSLQSQLGVASGATRYDSLRRSKPLSDTAICNARNGFRRMPISSAVNLDHMLLRSDCVQHFFTNEGTDAVKREKRKGKGKMLNISL